jgi:cation-transporting ATPase 13A1
VESRSIKKIDLYQKRPVYAYGFVMPYVLLYLLIFYMYGVYWSKWEEKESGIYVFLLSCGFVCFLQILTWLFCEWNMNFRVFCKFFKTERIEKANVVRVIPPKHKGDEELCIIYIQKEKEPSKQAFWFSYQKRKYTYVTGDEKIFCKTQFPVHQTFSYYRQQEGFKNEKDIEKASELYGKNAFDIPIPTFKKLFREHAIAPFFIFQVFCIGLWCLDEYWYYSLFTLFMLIMFESTVVFQRLKNLKEIRGMTTKPYPIYVYRQKKWVSVLSDSIFPGDIVSIVRSKEGKVVPCDILLMHGSCIINEAMLTGESTPQLKVILF